MIQRQLPWTGSCICWAPTPRHKTKFIRSSRKCSVTPTPSHFYDIICFPAGGHSDSSFAQTHLCFPMLWRTNACREQHSALAGMIVCPPPINNSWLIFWYEVTCGKYFNLYLLCYQRLISYHLQLYSYNWQLFISVKGYRGEQSKCHW